MHAFFLWFLILRARSCVSVCMRWVCSCAITKVIKSEVPPAVAACSIYRIERVPPLLLAPTPPKGKHNSPPKIAYGESNVYNKNTVRSFATTPHATQHTEELLLRCIITKAIRCVCVCVCRCRVVNVKYKCLLIL